MVKAFEMDPEILDVPTPMPPLIFSKLEPRFPMQSWKRALGPMVASALGGPLFISVPFLDHKNFEIFNLFTEEPEGPLIGYAIQGYTKRLKFIGNLSESLVNMRGRPVKNMDLVKTNLGPCASFYMEGHRGDVTKGFRLLMQKPSKTTLGDNTLHFKIDNLEEDVLTRRMLLVCEYVRVEDLHLKMYHSDKEIWQFPACNSTECSVGEWHYSRPATVAVKLVQLQLNLSTALLEEGYHPDVYEPHHVTWTLPLQWQTGLHLIHENYCPTGSMDHPYLGSHEGSMK